MLGLLEIFFSPGKVYERVRDRGSWAAPFIGVMLFAALSSAVMVGLVGMETIVRKQIESNQKAAQQLGPEGVEQRVRMANTPLVKGLTYVAPPVVVAVMMLGLAGILMGGMSLSGATVRYPQMLGTTAYTWFPFSVLGVLMITLILNLTQNRADLDFQNLIALNLGAFMDKQTTSKPLYSLATSFDLLSFAQMGLLSYGLSKVARLPIGRCFGLVFALWIVWILGKAGLASLF